MGRGQEESGVLTPVDRRGDFRERENKIFSLSEKIRQGEALASEEKREHLVALLSSLHFESPGQAILSRYRLMKIAELFSDNQGAESDLLEAIIKELPEEERDVFRLFLKRDWGPGESEALAEKYLNQEGISFERLGAPFNSGSLRLSSGEEIAFLRGRALPEQKGYGSGAIQDISGREILESAESLKEIRGQLEELLAKLEKDSLWGEKAGLQSGELQRRLKRLFESDVIASLEEMVLSSGTNPLRATEARLTYINLLSEMHLLLEDQFESVLLKSAAEHLKETRMAAAQGTLFASIDDFPERKKALQDLTEEEVEKNKEEIRLLRDTLLRDLAPLSSSLSHKGRVLAEEDDVLLKTDGGHLQYLLFREALGEIKRGEHGNSDQLLNYLEIHLSEADKSLWGKTLVGQEKESEDALPNILSAWVDTSRTGNEEETAMKSLQKVTRLIYGAKLAETDPKLKPLTDELFAREAELRQKAAVAGSVSDSPLLCLPNEVWSSTGEGRFFSPKVAPRVYEKEIIEGGMVSGHHFWDEDSFRSVVYAESLYSQFMADENIQREEWGKKMEMVAVHELIHSSQPFSLDIGQAIPGYAISPVMRESLNEGLTQLLTYTRISPEMAAAAKKENLPIRTSFDSKYIDEVSAWLKVFDLLRVPEKERASLLDTLNSLTPTEMIGRMDEEVKKRVNEPRFRDKSFLEIWDELLSPEAVTRKRNE